MPQLLIHRGLAKKKFLENSIKSFDYCFNKNFGIETDIHACLLYTSDAADE